MRMRPCLKAAREVIGRRKHARKSSSYLLLEHHRRRRSLTSPLLSRGGVEHPCTRNMSLSETSKQQAG